MYREESVNTNTTSSQVRVRFAPSPTGYPHLGNIRTALFNWLFARHHGGIFILRIENTDVARTVEGAVDMILSSLKWLGMDWDEGPVYQAERLPLYHEIAGKLVQEGKAYPCYCSPERLKAMREEQVKRKQPPGYDRLCRCLSAEERAQKEAEGITPVIRFKSPTEGQTTFLDLIRGEITFENSTLDDFVLLKSDGYPTYHLANIVDDHEMNITHVLRADEWVSSTPRHTLLYQAVGWQPPYFAHLPMILGPDKSKLSKRHGATSIKEYEDQGYLPETMINFLTLLGWSLDDKTELMSRQEIIANFSLERVSKTAAVFNREKLEWMNGVYIRNLSADDLAQRAMPFLERDLPPEIARPLNADYIRAIVPLVQERARTLSEIPPMVDFFLTDTLEYDKELLRGKLEEHQAAEAISSTLPALEQVLPWDTQTLEEMMRARAEELGLKAGPFFGIFRVAVTGRKVSPPLFETMEVLGRERSLQRIRKALEKLRA